MTVPYAGACSNANPKEKGLSTGSILLIIFFVSVSVYLIIGILYNMFVAKESGWNTVPHINFWTSALLFSLVTKNRKFYF